MNVRVKMIRIEICTRWCEHCGLFVAVWLGIIARNKYFADKTGNSWPNHVIKSVGIVIYINGINWQRPCGLFVYA